jgi:hypothetical protein
MIAWDGGLSKARPWSRHFEFATLDRLPSIKNNCVRAESVTREATVMMVA